MSRENIVAISCIIGAALLAIFLIVGYTLGINWVMKPTSQEELQRINEQTIKTVQYCEENGLRAGRTLGGEYVCVPKEQPHE